MGLPDWCTALPDAAAMRAIDRWAIEERGVPSLDLMERAGAGVARTVEELAPDGLVAVVCGKGNNGGDGLVAARLLREDRREVRVLTVAPAADLRRDAHAHPARLPASAAAAIEAIQSAATVAPILERGQPRVVSVDVPSGVDASTGEATHALSATATVTFHAAKPGLWIHPGKARAGEIRVLDIGIPRGAPVPAAADLGPPATAAIGLIQASVLDGLPHRGASSTKFSSGHVLLAGGSRGLTGAPRMSALAAMRTGAGYVTACAPGSQHAILATG